MNKAINSHQFQDAFFTNVVSRCVEECVNYYGERLVAIYVWGSVHRQEAVRGTWRNDQINDQLEKEFPDLKWGLIPHSNTISQAPHNTIATDTEHEAMRNRNTDYLFLYNATLVFGEDVTTGLIVPPPDKAFARWVLPTDPMKLARYAAGVETENRSNFELPKEPSLKCRKLARLAVLGGAYLLMSQGRYKSDTGADVFPLLKPDAQWADFLDCTRIHYINPIETTPEQVDEYSKKLVSWLEWVELQLN
jgi:hypothetical protein